MAWKVELDPAAERDLSRLDPKAARRILEFLDKRLAGQDDPRSTGSALKGPRFGEFWKYRVGDWRMICKIEDQLFTVFVLHIRHRSSAYRA